VATARGFTGPTGFEGAGLEPETPTPSEGANPPGDGDRGLQPRRNSQWWHRHLESSERQRVMAELAIKRQDHWAFRFSVMTTLSVIVAVMGLSATRQPS
jgi:hypothetical protein